MPSLTRRATLIGFAAAPVVLRSPTWAAEEQLPILFVGPDYDDASQWYTTIWRFESNGYDRKRMFAFDFPNPEPPAAADYGKQHPGHSGWGEKLVRLSEMVQNVKRQTGADKIVLIAMGGHGLRVRNYIKNANGLDNVAKVVLCGTPNHGHFATDDPKWLKDDYNALGYLLRDLNDGDEAPPPVQWLTIRSDNFDAWYQPVMNPMLPAAEGKADRPSHIGHASPELKGATNIVIPRIDVVQTVAHPEAFRAMYRFITGREPAHLDVVPESPAIQNGIVGGATPDNFASNTPVAGATVEIYEVSPATGERKSEAVHRQVTGPDGVWGPWKANPNAYHEIVITAAGYPVNHWYRNPFPAPARSNTCRCGCSTRATSQRPRASCSSGGAPGAFLATATQSWSMASRFRICPEARPAASRPRLKSPPMRFEPRQW